MTQSCPCCGSVEWTRRPPGFVICQSCGMMTLQRQFSLEEIKKEYGADYFHGREYIDYVADAPVQQTLLRAHLGRVERYVAPGARLLEIGCAYGYFLDLLRRQYPQSVGVDVSSDAVASARRRGLDARDGDLLETDIAGPFDGVCLWDTIEHLTDPVAVMQRAVDLLSPGGYVFLTTGDLGSLLARAQGLRWRQIHPPTHLFYFTRRALTLLCGRLGVTVLALETVTIYRRLGSSLRGWEHRYRGSWSASVAGWLAAVLPERIRAFDFPLNLGDTVFLAARKDR
jgi:SAM-dependent methyltransferase